MTYDNFHAWRKERGLNDLLIAMKGMDDMRSAYLSNPNKNPEWSEVPVIVRQEFVALFEGMRALFNG